MNGLQRAFEKNKNQGYSHMLIVREQEEQHSYFYYVKRTEDIQSVMLFLQSKNCKVQYVFHYDLEYDFQAQTKKPYFIQAMDEIVINDHRLLDIDIKKTKEKARAILFSKGKLVLVNYAGIYMLPGGKVDELEDHDTTLKRELQEELGLVLTKLVPFVRIKHYMKNYPQGKTTINNLVQTDYYCALSEVELDPMLMQLTQKEKEHGFHVVFIDFEKARDLVLHNVSSNPRHFYFQQELLSVLDEYHNSKVFIHKQGKR